MNALFAPGDRVRVRNDWPEAGPVRVHVRTPHYLRGREGIVERRLGSFPNPEELAFGKPGLPARMLYQVRFARAGLWSGAGAGPADTVVADLYEHWLEPAEERHG
ncbi:MAG TPA: SH3-like domain-containing protein [Alphaproteobacteria bacterium]